MIAPVPAADPMLSVTVSNPTGAISNSPTPPGRSDATSRPRVAGSSSDAPRNPPAHARASQRPLASFLCRGQAMCNLRQRRSAAVRYPLRNPVAESKRPNADYLDPRQRRRGHGGSCVGVITAVVSVRGARVRLAKP